MNVYALMSLVLYLFSMKELYFPSENPPIILSLCDTVISGKDLLRLDLTQSITAGEYVEQLVILPSRQDTSTSCVLI